eukprot:TRINITY_DN19002_c0_g1_i1.p1 TRINITY_DN19002_c0_g1~~TRINITY_DN19002_c0_g1_i1.p1  ORF type:complete len:154 (-),score=8.50 TRINITY_DN19002_c0_g1_i1:674-1135(-)
MVRQNASHGGGVSSLNYLFGEPTYLKNTPAPLDLEHLEAGLPSHRVSRVKDGANPVLPHVRSPDTAGPLRAKGISSLQFEPSASAESCLKGDEQSNWGYAATPTSVTQASFSPKPLTNGSARPAAGFQALGNGGHGKPSQLGESQIGYLFGKD